MPQLSQRSTVYFNPALHKALRLKAAEENRSISEIVNEAIALLPSEDTKDIDAIDARAGEQDISYAEFVQSLKSNGIL